MIDTQNYTNTNTNKHKIVTRNNAKLLYPELSYLIQGVIYEVRKQYGPGQKEVIYHRVLEEKFLIQNLTVEREKRINIYSQDSGKIVGLYQPDLIIENKIILEVKSSSFTTKIDEKQLYHYLRNSEYELGYLINFSTPKLYIKRIIYTNDRKPYLQVRVVSCSNSCLFVSI